MADPALERADPALAVPGSVTLTRAEAEVLTTEGTWMGATVTGKRRDTRGRWCIGLRWYASPTIGERQDWFIYDSERIRPFRDAPA